MYAIAFHNARCMLRVSTELSCAVLGREISRWRSSMRTTCQTCRVTLREEIAEDQAGRDSVATTLGSGRLWAR
jgi:hypothetical protein